VPCAEKAGEDDGRVPLQGPPVSSMFIRISKCGALGRLAFLCFETYRRHTSLPV
jgi:hypothetical protein